MAADNRAVSDSRVDAVRRAANLFSVDDPEAWAACAHELFTSDAEWHSALATRVHRGHEGICEWHRLTVEGFVDAYTELHHIEQHGDRVLTLTRFHGVFAATGAVIERRIGIVWEFDGERCRRATSYVDWAEARAAAGAPFRELGPAGLGT
jgi:ketosteroid isomerase-like protein